MTALPGMIKSLSEPAAYPDNPSGVELRQTHISYILLTPEYVYKIKKPVDFGFLDFTTLEKRRHYCEEEVRLNRRLSEGLYLGVVNITEQDGAYRMEGQGEPVEYAVKMKRLREETLLPEMIAGATADAGVIRRIAHRIALFHRLTATDGRISEYGRPEAIRRNVEENFEQTSDQVGSAITEELYGRIKTYTADFLRSNEGLLNSRVAGGFIRDCHGDLHAEHVSVTNGINVFDCIEFNERFRYSDVVADICFLSMDLDYLGRADLSRVLDRAYFAETNDSEGEKLADFYKCYRAYVRGKVEGFKFFEPEVTGPEKTAALVAARRHYHLSGLYASGGYAPMLVVVRGLSGTGKSTVARMLGEHGAMTVISSDAVRKEIAGVPIDARAEYGYKEGIYAEEFTERTYAELVGRAQSLLKEGRPVVLDATFSRASQLDSARDAAVAGGAGFHLVECTADEDTIRERCASRSAAAPAPGVAASDAGWEVHLRQKKSYEETTAEHITIDTTLSPEEILKELSARIYA